MESQIVIRPFRPGDEHAFQRLNEAWIEANFGMEEKDREVLSNPFNHILKPGGAILMAFDGREAVGCCALIRIGEGEYEVAKMTISASHRGRGLGRRILSETVENARSLGATRLYLETNSRLTDAIHLYESLGFRHLPAERIKKSPYARANVYMELLVTALV